MSLSIVKQRGRFEQALSSIPFLRMWLGQTTSIIGDYAFTAALAWQVLLLSHSATLMGLIVSVQIVMQMLSVLSGGVVADRFSRRLVMLSSDFGRAIIILGIAGMSWFHLLHVWHLFLLCVLFGLVQGFFQPAYQSIVPELVSEDALPSANALLGLSRTIGKLVGPLLGAVAIVIIGPALAFAFDGVTFLIASVSMMQPYSSQSPVRRMDEQNSERRTMNVLAVIRRLGSEVGEGVAYTLRTKWLWLFFIAEAILNMTVVGATEVAFPKLIQDVYQANAWLLGSVVTSGAFGVLLATILVGQIQRGHRGTVSLLLAICACLGVLFIGVPLPAMYEPVVACMSNIVIGFGLGGFSILLNTLVQEHTAPEKLGRVYSLNILGSLCLVPPGFFLTGIGSDAIGSAGIFLVNGAIALVCMGISLSIPAIRRLS